MPSQGSRALVSQLFFVFTLEVNKKASILRAQKWRGLSSPAHIFSSVCFRDCHSNTSLFNPSLICLHEADQKVEIQPSRMSLSRKNLAFDLFLCFMLWGKCFILQSKKVFKWWKTVISGNKKNNPKNLNTKQNKQTQTTLKFSKERERIYFFLMILSSTLCFYKTIFTNEQ